VGLVVDRVDPVVHLQRAARPSRQPPADNGAVRAKAPTPALPPPVIARPTVWTASQMSYEEVIAAVEELEEPVSSGGWDLRRRVREVEQMLDWLVPFPGESWQQRWHASNADEAGKAWTDLVVADSGQAVRRRTFTGAVGRLILLDVVRPDYSWLYSAVAEPTLFARFRELRDRDGFAAMNALCEANQRLQSTDRGHAMVQLTRMLMHNGGRLADITLTDCVEAYRAQTGYTAGQHSHWYTLLRQSGILPEDSPPTIYAASRKGQLTIEELVDRYDVQCRPIRDLFVAYLHERRPGMDYTSIRYLTSKIVLLFWRDLEIHEPGIDSLHLSDDVARRWKQRLSDVVQYGSHRVGQKRQDPYTILMAVRAFYADLSHWALKDPARWAQWAAPTPVDSRDLAGMTKMQKQSRSRMHQRTRELAPLLPRLIDAAATRRKDAQALLDAARDTLPGEVIATAGQPLRRAVMATDPQFGGTGRQGVVYATPADGPGQKRNLTREADRAFWTWALVEVFRHTGARIEEVMEITHRSFVSYTLPSTGEVVPMLQITPSKTDKERLLVISPELAMVFAEIISRVRGGNDHMPLVSRYDAAERVHSPALPFLFQRQWGVRDIALTNSYAIGLLNELVAAAKIQNPDGTPAKFSPHDFRRIFATEAVASGLPVHITAKILGHESIATTQTYVAVYDQDVVEHHRAFIARRRALRPSEEYREPTDSEWDEFLGHFAKRKLELGTCGRAYGTGCQHEHACIRCPMLRPDPAQQDRLEQIITSLGEASPKPNNAAGRARWTACAPAWTPPTTSSSRCVAPPRTSACPPSARTVQPGPRDRRPEPTALGATLAHLPPRRPTGGTMRSDTRTLEQKIADRNAKLEALHQKLTAAVEQLVTGDDWQRALGSATPNATRLAAHTSATSLTSSRNIV
jgi:integrase